MTDARGIVQIVMLLPWRAAASFSASAALSCATLTTRELTAWRSLSAWRRRSVEESCWSERVLSSRCARARTARLATLWVSSHCWGEWGARRECCCCLLLGLLMRGLGKQCPEARGAVELATHRQPSDHIAATVVETPSRQRGVLRLAGCRTSR